MKTEKKVTKTEVREKFQGEHYPIHVFARHIEITDAIKSYGLDKLVAALDRYGARVIDALVVMDLQRGIHMVDFLITMNNTKILVSGRAKDMYASIDEAITHLKTKLSRYHRQLHELNRTKIEWAKHAENGIDPLDDINDMIEEETLEDIEAQLRPALVSKRERSSLHSLTEEEAIAKLEISIDACILYRGQEDGKIKVIYRLHDGTYAIVEEE